MSHSKHSRIKPPINSVKISIAFLFLLLAGCTYDVPVKIEKPVTRPEGVETVPVTMGVYYSPDFLDYKQKVTILGGHKLNFEIGESSAELFTKLLPELFKQVHVIEGRPPYTATAPMVDAVLEPGIEKVSIQDPGFVGWAGTYHVQITYRFILYNLDGEPVAYWTASGAGRNTKKVSMGGVDEDFIAAEAVAHALEDAGQNFMKGFARNPEVNRWFRERNQVDIIWPRQTGFDLGVGG